jgi:hypothetical protein
MVAFEVSVNGKRRYLAGHDDAQFLQIEMTGNFLGRGVFGVNGFVALPTAREGQLETLSYPGELLSVGDEVTIRIIEVDRADHPTKHNMGEGSMRIVADAE